MFSANIGFNVYKRIALLHKFIFTFNKKIETFNQFCRDAYALLNISSSRRPFFRNKCLYFVKTCLVDIFEQILKSKKNVYFLLLFHKSLKYDTNKS